MKVSLNWIRKYTDIDVSDQELVKLATERLGGIESVENYGEHYRGIVVAKLVSVKPHPNADKLNLCLVDDGGVVQDVERNDQGLIQVVCGDPKIKEGMLAAWIPPGSIVPASYGDKELFVLDARELRGEVSNGMLASSKELAINDDHSGIMEITADVKPGTMFVEMYDLDDTILDIENKMFTHRPDGFGHLGVAREIAGIQHKKFTSPDWYLNPGQITVDEDKVSCSVKIEDKNCPRYMAVALEIKLGPSPIWLQSYLSRVGLKSINNVVDITNYIMMLTGKPIHAFDFDKIAKDDHAELIVRRSKEGEKIPLLNGKTIQPWSEAVVIASQDGPIGLGGLIGGANSEIDSKTRRIVIENATFDMYNMRKTSMRHGIFTDATTRFTKGQPAGQLDSVLYHTIDMLRDLASARVISEVEDTVLDAESITSPIEVSSDFINERLGKKLSAEEHSTILNNVEVETKVVGNKLSVIQPFWRTDLEIPEDIVEEVGRLSGFNELPSELPYRSISPPPKDELRDLGHKVREILSSAGANEVLSYSFVHGDLLDKVGQNPENSYAIRNALSPNLQYYRQTLSPSLLSLVKPNIKSGNKEFALFELGKVYNKVHGNGDDGLPGEIKTLGLVFSSIINEDETGYYQARRILDFLGQKLGLEFVYKPISEQLDYPMTSVFDQSRSALVSTKQGTFIGIIGEYRREVIKKLKLPECSAGFEISPESLLEAIRSGEGKDYKVLSVYPAVDQDLTFTVTDETTFLSLSSELEDGLKDSEYNWDLEPLGIYRPEGSKTRNMSFRISVDSSDRTLTSAEVKQLVQSLEQRVDSKFNATLV